MANVRVQAIINLPQFGLRPGDIGDVDKDLAAGPLARGFCIEEGKSAKKPSAPEVVDE